MLALVRVLAALPELAHHCHRFLQHLEPDVRRWPSVTEDVLVERFAAAHAEREPPRQHRRRRRGRVGDDRRVRADQGARHCRTDSEARRGRDPTDDGPDERALSLSIGPRMKMVRQPHALEAELLGTSRGMNHVPRVQLFAGE